MSGGKTRRRPPRDSRQRLIELAARYGAPDASARFFAPPARPLLREAPAESRMGGARVVDLSFPSTYRPLSADYVDEYARYGANLTAHARLYAGGSEPRPTAICLHGWGGGAYWLEERAFVVPYLLRIGLDVAVFQLPFHGRRTPRGRKAGALFPSPHVVRTNEAFGQAIFDLRALVGALLDRGAPSVGVMGMSLGGYTTALLASVDERLAFAVPMIPAADMAALMWGHGSNNPTRRRAEQAGVGLDLLRKAFRVHSPLERQPLLDRSRLMIIAGQGDRITPPEQAEWLWEHWQRPEIYWFAGGHLAQIGRGNAFRALRRHLTSVGVAR